jgi:hypothetical protein
MSTGRSIGASLAQAASEVEQRKARIAALLARHPDGYTIGKFTKATISGDVFWIGAHKGLTGGQLLEALGTKLVKFGALTEAEFYT